MTSKEIIKNKIAGLEDDYQHYTMVDKDKVKAHFIKTDIEEHQQILQDLERKEQLEKEYKLLDETMEADDRIIIQLTEEKEQLEKENKELRGKNFDLSISNIELKQEIFYAKEKLEKLEKSIEILKDLLNLSLCIEEYEPNNDRIPLLCTKNNEYILNDNEYDLLKEVLE